MPTQENTRTESRWDGSTISELKPPATPRDQVNNAFQDAKRNTEALATARLTDPELLRLSDWNNLAQSNPHMQDRRAQFVQQTVRDVLAAHPMPSQAVQDTWFLAMGLVDPTSSGKASPAARAKFAADFESTIRKTTEKVLNECLEQFRKKEHDTPLIPLVNDLKITVNDRTPKTSSAYDTKTWVTKARDVVEKLDPEQFRKLQDKLTAKEINLERPCREFLVRNLMMAGSSTLALAFATYSFATQGATQGGLGAAVALLLNAGVNMGLAMRHDARMEQLVGSTKTLIKEAGSMPAVAMWLGVLNHTLDKFNPILMLGREKCKPLGSNSSETTMEYTRNALKDVANHACSQIDLKASPHSTSRLDWLSKDSQINSKWAQIESNIASLTSRWSTIPNLLNYGAIFGAATSVVLSIDSVVLLFK